MLLILSHINRWQWLPVTQNVYFFKNSENWPEFLEVLRQLSTPSRFNVNHKNVYYTFVDNIKFDASTGWAIINLLLKTMARSA